MLFGQHSSEEDSGLLPVGVRVGVGVPPNLPGCLELVPLGRWLLDRPAHSIGLIVNLTFFVGCDVHGAISLIVIHSGLVWAVDRNLLIVGAQSVSVGVGVGEESALEHLVVGGFDPWHHVGGGEGRLLHLGEVVGGVLVQHHLAHGYQGVVTMGPHLGDVVDVISVLLSFCLRDELNIECPRGEVSLLDIIKQILGSIVLVAAGEGFGFFGAQTLVALVGLEGVLHEEGLTLLVHPLVGVRAVPIHVAESIWGPLWG